MLWLLSLTMTIASGWFLARALTAGVWNGPRWTTIVVEVALGVLFGPGIASVLYFAMLAASVASKATVFAMLVLLLAASAALWWKLTAPQDAPNEDTLPENEPRAVAIRRTFPWNWALWICVALGLVFFFLDFQTASNANPAGEWDAMAIWNLRARYLASDGGLWRRAVAGELGGHMTGAAHPGYPLFLSGFLALNWVIGGLTNGMTFDETVPIVVSLLFAMAAVALLGGSLASRKSVALGLLAWLVLFASEVFSSQSAAQYSDLLQGLAFLSALVLLDAAAQKAEPRLLAAAGLAIGLSCWIKNEGLPFALAAFAVAVWRFRPRGITWLALGALPGALALAVLKLFFVQGREAMFPTTSAEFISKLTGAGRWWQAALGFGKAIFEAGNVWTHPVLLAALLALVLHFIPSDERRSRLWVLIPVGVTAASEYGLYLITTADLDWHISTSVSRLVAQLWPSLLWAFFMFLRTPEEAYPAASGISRKTAPETAAFSSERSSRTGRKRAKQT